MARQGRCHCGQVLRFERGEDGYKTRCPACGKVVRLHKPAAVDAGKLAPPPKPLPLPPVLPPTVKENTDQGHGTLPSTVVELAPWPAGPPPPASHAWLWLGLAIGLGISLVGAGIVTVVVMCLH